jgi:MFS family permease
MAAKARNYSSIQESSDIRTSNPYHSTTSSNLFSHGPKRRALFTRWQSLAGIALFISVAGTTYAYGIFSVLMRMYLGYDQDQLDLIASIGNNGLYLSLVAGFLIERLGFKRVIRIGGLFIFIGFFYIWLAVKEFISSSQSTISFFYFLSQLGVCFHIASAMAVAVRLFPHSAHGGAIGLTKGYFAISTAVLSDIAGGIFESNATGFLLFIAIFIPIVGFFGSSQANILPPHLLDLSYEHRKGMYTSLDPFIIHWAVLFLTLTLIGYIEYAYELAYWQEVVTFLMIIAVVFSLLMVPRMYGDIQIPVEDCIPSESAANLHHSNEDEEPYFYESIPSEQLPPELVEAQRRKYLFSEYLSLSPAPPADSSSQTNQNESDDNPGNAEKVRSKRDRLAGEVYVSDDEDDIEPGDTERQRLMSPQLATDINSQNLHNAHLGNPKNDGNSKNAVKYPKARSLNADPSFSYLTDTCFYGDNMPLMDAIKTWRLWAFFCHYLITTGVGLMVIYNVYSIAESVDKVPTSFFVTLIALANALGRVVAGWISDYSADAWSVSKLMLLSLVVFLMGLVQFILSFGFASFLFPGLLLVGFLFGCAVSLTAINVADIFGEKYIATNFGFVDAAPIFGSYIYATWLVTSFYSENAIITTDDYGTETGTCSGADCFRYPFLINAGSCLVAFSIVWMLDKYTPR